MSLITKTKLGLSVVQSSLAQPQAKLPASLMNGEQFLRPLLFSSVLAADF
jgi:hypothetical protein